MATATKDMLISQLLQLDRGTAAILMSNGMHCIGCPMSQAESLEEACVAHGIDVDALVEQLNEYLKDKEEYVDNFSCGCV